MHRLNLSKSVAFCLFMAERGLDLYEKQDRACHQEHSHGDVKAALVSLEKLAELSGVSKTMIGQIERGAVEIEGGGSLGSGAHQEGTEEFLTVFSGELAVEIKGEMYTLRAGASLQGRQAAQLSQRRSGAGPREHGHLLFGVIFCNGWTRSERGLIIEKRAGRRAALLFLCPDD